MIGEENHIDLYPDTPYATVKKFAKSFWRMLHGLSLPNRQNLCHLLHYTKATAVCEILQPSYQHVVRIRFQEDTIIFLAFTPSYRFSFQSLTAFPPLIASKLMQILGVPSAPCEILPSTHITQAFINNVRRRVNTEGLVFYTLNQNHQTIGMTKMKTIWYIFLRAMREKISWFLSQKNKSFNLEELEMEIFKRYKEIEEWLKLTERDTEVWRRTAKFFVSWMLIKQRKFQQPSAFQVKSQFPIYWENFQKEFKEKKKETPNFVIN